MGDVTMTSPSMWTGGASGTGGVIKSEYTWLRVEEGFGINEMMTWLATTMSKSDSDIRLQMSDINAKKDLAAELSKVITALKNAESAKVGSDSGRDCKGVPLKDLESQAWFKALPKETQEAMLRLKSDTFEGGDTIADENIVRAAREALVDFSASLTSTNDIAMVKLQSAVAARGQALQLVSNMLNAFNETSNRIIGNTK